MGREIKLSRSEEWNGSQESNVFVKRKKKNTLLKFFKVKKIVIKRSVPGEK